MAGSPLPNFAPGNLQGFCWNPKSQIRGGGNMEGGVGLVQFQWIRGISAFPWESRISGWTQPWSFRSSRNFHSPRVPSPGMLNPRFPAWSWILLFIHVPGGSWGFLFPRIFRCYWIFVMYPKAGSHIKLGIGNLANSQKKLKVWPLLIPNPHPWKCPWKGLGETWDNGSCRCPWKSWNGMGLKILPTQITP